MAASAGSALNVAVQCAAFLVGVIVLIAYAVVVRSAL